MITQQVANRRFRATDPTDSSNKSKETKVEENIPQENFRALRDARQKTHHNRTKCQKSIFFAQNFDFV